MGASIARRVTIRWALSGRASTKWTTAASRENDLVLGTFDRGVYILDDYSGLREVGADMLGQAAQLLPVRTTHAYNEYRLGQPSTAMVETPNPPVGAAALAGAAAARRWWIPVTTRPRSARWTATR